MATRPVQKRILTAVAVVLSGIMVSSFSPLLPSRIPERPSVITKGYSTDHSDIAPNTIFSSDYDPDLNSAYLSDNEVSIGIPSPLIITEERVLRKALEVLDNFSMKLSNDIDLSNSTLEIPSGKTVTFDLGGFTLDRKLTKRGEGGGQVITIREGATLNLSNGTLTMKGGAITGNTSKDKEKPTGGGGIFNAEGATVSLTGVTITGNEAKTYGGGGINNWGTLTIDGCTITGNTSNEDGSGVWSGPGSTLNLQGKNTITDNQAGGKANNVYLYNTVITVTGSLEGSQIGIRMENPGTFTSGYSTNNKDVAPVKYFLSDNEDYTVVLRDNEAELKKKMEDGIRSASMDNEQLIMDNSWYTLDGRKIQGKPTTKGVYIHNGKKVAQ